MHPSAVTMTVTGGGVLITYFIFPPYSPQSHKGKSEGDEAWVSKAVAF